MLKTGYFAILLRDRTEVTTKMYYISLTRAVNVFYPDAIAFSVADTEDKAKAALEKIKKEKLNENK